MGTRPLRGIFPGVTSGMDGRPPPDNEDPGRVLCTGERQFRGEMAPLVRILEARGLREAMLSRDPPGRLTIKLGGCSQSVPLPSEWPPLSTTVSQENSEEDALVEVPVPVRSDPDCPDPPEPPLLSLEADELLDLRIFLRLALCNLADS